MQHHPPDALVENAQNSQKDAAFMSQANTEQLKSLVAGLATTDPFTKERIERLCGISLLSRPDAPDGQFFYQAQIEEGAFSAVQLRHSGPTQADGYALVILDLRPDEDLTVSNLRGRLFPPDAERAFNRNIPPDGTVTYIVERPGLTARFEFGAANDQLLTMSFRRTVKRPGVAHV